MYRQLSRNEQAVHQTVEIAAKTIVAHATNGKSVIALAKDLYSSIEMQFAPMLQHLEQLRDTYTDAANKARTRLAEENPHASAHVIELMVAKVPNVQAADSARSAYRDRCQYVENLQNAVKSLSKYPTPNGSLNDTGHQYEINDYLKNFIGKKQDFQGSAWNEIGTKCCVLLAATNAHHNLSAVLLKQGHEKDAVTLMLGSVLKDDKTGLDDLEGLYKAKGMQDKIAPLLQTLHDDIDRFGRTAPEHETALIKQVNADFTLGLTLQSSAKAGATPASTADATTTSAIPSPTPK